MVIGFSTLTSACERSLQKLGHFIELKMILTASGKIIQSGVVIFLLAIRASPLPGLFPSHWPLQSGQGFKNAHWNSFFQNRHTDPESKLVSVDPVPCYKEAGPTTCPLLCNGKTCCCLMLTIALTTNLPLWVYGRRYCGSPRNASPRVRLAGSVTREDIKTRRLAAHAKYKLELW